ncbi:DUF1672 family protein [Rossellomorea vietnamensis]|uniref:DUF1672 family protein n=1 Tax=Rossellomorea vietnamensis TaxID=218284 RepID=A0A0P6W1D6_9BACI|nr:DUF1672 family protein [Rossellomorea vietnamensis]KPL59213.1 hypothetical protein AM506_11825 [Rossellomorea vietnamensis]
MNRKWIGMNYMVVLSIILGGCIGTKENEIDHSEIKDQFVSIQEYKGDEFALINGVKTDKIAESHREEVVKAVKRFFLDEYNTQVKVHNLVGNEDGVTVYVESVGTPAFHAYAVVPIDVENNTVLGNQVFSLEGEVENAITSGVYGLVFEEEFARLNDLLKEITKKKALRGKTSEAINNTQSFGYGNEYYFVSVFDMELSNRIVEMYLQNTEYSKEDWERALQIEETNPESINITIQLYKKEKDILPTKEELGSVVKTIEKADGLPYGAYNILLHDNSVDRYRGMSNEEHSVEKVDPDYLIKDTY